jgi:hypothetical protein
MAKILIQIFLPAVPSADTAILRKRKHTLPSHLFAAKSVGRAQTCSREQTPTPLCYFWPGIVHPCRSPPARMPPHPNLPHEHPPSPHARRRRAMASPHRPSPAPSSTPVKRRLPHALLLIPALVLLPPTLLLFLPASALSVHIQTSSALLSARGRRAAKIGLRWYLRQLHYYPFGVRALSAAAIFFAADLIAQLLTLYSPPQKSPSDVAIAPLQPLPQISGARLLRYTTYGLTVMGPFLYLWYSMMEAFGPEDDLRGALAKSLFEQITLEPMCIAMYIVYDGVVCRRGYGATARKLRNEFFKLWLKNALFWVPANFSNYYVGTPDMRVLFANLCSLFWNCYFSMKMSVLIAPLAKQDGFPSQNFPKAQTHAQHPPSQPDEDRAPLLPV